MDKKVICIECKNEFIISEQEQKFYAELGFVLPKRCANCRAKNRREKQIKIEQPRKTDADNTQNKHEEEQKQLEALLSKLSIDNAELKNLVVPNSHESLVVIGNGFDIMHGAKSSYYEFQKTIGKNNPLRHALEIYLKCEDLWYNFEESLASLDVGAMVDTTDMWLTDFDAYSVDAKASDYYLSIETAYTPIQILINDLPRRFRAWVETLTCDGRKPLLNVIQPKAIYLNFNYTDFLEILYNVPHNGVEYIHGCRKKQKGKPKEKLVLGHVPDVDYFKDYKPSWQALPRYKSKRKAYLLDSAIDIGVSTYVTAYEQEFTKKTSEIIENSKEFFVTTQKLKDVFVIGHSLSRVDYPYFMEIAKYNCGKAKWHLSYHSLNDLKRIIEFIDAIKIKNVEIFKV